MISYVSVTARMAARFKNVMNKDIRTLKDTSENLNTQKRTIDQEGFYQVFYISSSQRSTMTHTPWPNGENNPAGQREK